ncbi:MAG TPA: efflux RND transporter periplasmic adaptor subunit, partial [Chloroflexota bacterium]|nr:efflux RND transporter periplasmic adaptor subunit [Chloroflexota bacterium]
ALITKEGKSQLFVVKGELAQLVAVETGISTDGKVEIVKGLVPGDEVVTAGASDLKDGDRVKKS